MEKLKTKDLQKITGGGLNLGAGLLIGAGVIFLIGVIDGYIRPLKCN